MEEYHKIQTVFLRDPENKHRTLLEGQFSLSEFEFLQNVRWLWTEKVDGINIRVVYNGYPLIKEVDFKGKTDNADIPKFLLCKLQETFPVELLEKVFSFDDIEDKEKMPMVTLYGEGYGVKIQKGGGNYIPDGQGFVLFDVKIGKWWLKREDVQDLALNLGIKHVPVVGSGTLFDMMEFVRVGFKSTWGEFPAEGVVARPEIELFARNGKRIITKLKVKDFKR